MDVKREQVKVALDIDGGKTTGEYYYDWYPVTVNALYAMPEKGARVEVYFGSRDEQEEFGKECFLFAKVKGLDRSVVVGRMDVVESMLRRGMQGFTLAETEVEERSGNDGTHLSRF